ncbi:hypothetical protein BJX64DRAFT_201421 [Aspergillus heterothallicus]
MVSFLMQLCVATFDYTHNITIALLLSLSHMRVCIAIPVTRRAVVRLMMIGGNHVAADCGARDRPLNDTSGINCVAGCRCLMPSLRARPLNPVSEEIWSRISHAAG